MYLFLQQQAVRCQATISFRPGDLCSTPLDPMWVVLCIVLFDQLAHLQLVAFNATPVVNKILFDSQSIWNRHTNFKRRGWNIMSIFLQVSHHGFEAGKSRELQCSRSRQRVCLLRHHRGTEGSIAWTVTSSSTCPLVS